MQNYTHLFKQKQKFIIKFIFNYLSKIEEKNKTMFNNLLNFIFVVFVFKKKKIIIK